MPKTTWSRLVEVDVAVPRLMPAQTRWACPKDDPVETWATGVIKTEEPVKDVLRCVFAEVRRCHNVGTAANGPYPAHDELRRYTTRSYQAGQIMLPLGQGPKRSVPLAPSKGFV